MSGFWKRDRLLLSSRTNSRGLYNNNRKGRWLDKLYSKGRWLDRFISSSPNSKGRRLDELYNNLLLDLLRINSHTLNNQDTKPQQFSLAHGPNGLSATHLIRNPSLKDDL
jgi:hypothetical protein